MATNYNDSIASDYCLAGIDFKLAGNGGPDCAGYIPFQVSTL
jgi:hypothetical protein